MRDHAKTSQYEIFDLFLFSVHLYIEKSMIELNENEILMPHVQSRHLDKRRKATQWKWLQ